MGKTSQKITCQISVYHAIILIVHQHSIENIGRNSVEIIVMTKIMKGIGIEIDVGIQINQKKKNM